MATFDTSLWGCGWLVYHWSPDSAVPILLGPLGDTLTTDPYPVSAADKGELTVVRSDADINNWNNGEGVPWIGPVFDILDNSSPTTGAVIFVAFPAGGVDGSNSVTTVWQLDTFVQGTAVDISPYWTADFSCLEGHAEDVLMEEAKCFRCIPGGEIRSVMIYLLTQWAKKV
jgi:hypothetical protein